MAECSCIRGNYNYHVEAVDSKTILYQDLSDWMDDEGYVYPQNYEVMVTPPLKFTPIPLSVDTGSFTKITSSEIGEVRDGIYCFQTSSCGHTYMRTKAIFPKIECCVKQAWVTLGPDKHEEIESVENHLKLATINAELNNVQLASKHLKYAQRKLENLKCDCDC